MAGGRKLTVGEAERAIRAFKYLGQRRRVAGVRLDDLGALRGQGCRNVVHINYGRTSGTQCVPFAASLAGLRVTARTAKEPSLRRNLATLPPWRPVAPVTTMIFLEDMRQTRASQKVFMFEGQHLQVVILAAHPSSDVSAVRQVSYCLISLTPE